MQRRRFLWGLTAGATSLSMSLPAYGVGEKRDRSDYGTGTGDSDGIRSIGSLSIERVREVFRTEFFERNLPLWREHVVDWKYGGYIPHVRPYINDTGEWVNTNKRLYHQGRCLWMYSYLYNTIERDELYLRAAKAGYDFLVKFCFDYNKNQWHDMVSREGAVVAPSLDIFSSIYPIHGLAEYYRATGDTQARDIAVRSAYRVMEILTSNWVQLPMHAPREDHVGTWREPGTRRLGCWIHLLSGLTPLLKYTKDEGLEAIARTCVRNILGRHYQRDKGYAFEDLQWDYTPYSKSPLTYDTLRVSDGFHSIEAAWMSMDEALRVGSPEIFTDALHFGHDVLSNLWLERDGEQGLVRWYWPDDPDPFARSNILDPYVMNEVWVFLLLGLEHTREQWLEEWFERSFEYSYTKKLVWPYGETLHHPRGLLFSLQILDRMIARKGRVSDFVETGPANRVRPNGRGRNLPPLKS